MTRGRTAIFVNEGAASARTERVRRTVDLAAAALQAEIRLTRTRDRDQLEAWFHQQLDSTSFETAIVVGGDGSLGVAYNVVASRDIALGYIPAGFGNATAHLLRMPRRPERIVDILVRGEARPVDLVSVDGRLALFAGAGWDAIVAGRYAAAGARRLVGWGSAVAESLPELLQRRSAEVVVDGSVIHRGMMEMVTVGTTPFYGRGLRVNPGAVPDGGRLMVRVYEGPASRFALDTLRWVTRRAPSAAGMTATAVQVRALDGRPIAVQADGDLVGERDAWGFEVRPASARLIGRWR